MHDAAPVSSAIARIDNIFASSFARKRCHLSEGQAVSDNNASNAVSRCRTRARRTLPVHYHLRKPVRTDRGCLGRWPAAWGITLCERKTSKRSVDSGHYQSTAQAYELELGETVPALAMALVANRPRLVDLDSLSKVSLIAERQMRYRRQALVLKHFLFRQGCAAPLLILRTAAIGA